ncbi:hypothetical protein L0F63_006892, partial [Massospora cicadina]
LKRESFFRMAKVTSQNPFDLLSEADFEGEVQAPKVQPKKEKSTSKPAEAAVSRSKAQENRSSKDATPRGPRSKPSRTEDVDSE